LRRFVAQHARKELGRRASDGLRRTHPLFSNAPRGHGARRRLALAIALPIAMLALAPAAVAMTASAALCAVFLAAAALRLASGAVRRPAADRAPRLSDHELPIYTLICALYREAGIVGNLVAAIRALDYPPEKLDVKFVLEADDKETRRALEKLELGAPFDVIIAPAIGPRTKPKALNVALAFAHGSFTGVYDAEDVPQPDQLRRAVRAFLTNDHRLACVQAPLTIDNTTDNWLTRMFTADYAGQFEVLMPALARLGLPLPLGGSSNHFRTAVLRQIGGWDSYNVTEDADLGMRLYRFGYYSAVLSPSPTYEEAPARFMPWLKQRTRWYKGWMQTWLVHMRRPRRLVGDLGVAGAVVFQLLFAGNVISALVHPLFLLGLCYALFGAPARPIAADDAAMLWAAALLCGYVSTIAPNILGLRRSGLGAHAWALALTPLYWLLLSLAAWRAFLHLLYDPQRWEKTEHGLARTSRLAVLDDQET